MKKLQLLSLFLILFLLCSCHTPPPSKSDTEATTSTAVSNKSDTNPSQITGTALTLENAEKKLTLPLVNGSVADEYHQGNLLFSEWTETNALYSLYSLESNRHIPLGETSLPSIGSGSTCFSADGRYYYTSHIGMEDHDYLSVFRIDIESKTTEVIEKIQYGRLMFFLYAEGNKIWRFWSEDPDNDGDASDFVRHIDVFDSSTGESSELFAAEGDYNINAVFVADRTIYAIIHHLTDDYYSLDTFTLNGEAISSYDLSFLNDVLGNRVELTAISVGGDFVFLTSSYAGQKIVLRQNDNTYQLVQGLSETEDSTRISGYLPSPSHNGFGYMFRNNGQTLVRYDEEDDAFVEHTLPENFYSLLFNEMGHLVVVYKDRIGGTADYYFFENITW